MGLHLTRGISATINVLLGGLLTWFWIYLASDNGFDGIDNIGDWMIVFSMVAMTVAAMISGASLLMRRTLPLGIKWNTITGLSWFAVAVGGVMSSLADGRFPLSDAQMVAILSSIGGIWFSLSWALRQFLNVELRKQATTQHSLLVGQAVSSVAAQVPLSSVLPVTSSQEASLIIGRRS